MQTGDLLQRQGSVMKWAEKEVTCPSVPGMRERMIED